MDLAPHIFQQYDIRGIVGTDLDPEVTRQVGRAYGSALRETSEARPYGWWWARTTDPIPLIWPRA